MVLCMDEVQLSTGYRQEFLVFIWPNSGGGKAESTLWPLNGFEPWTPAECPSPPLPSQKDGNKLTSKFEHRTMRIQYRFCWQPTIVLCEEKKNQSWQNEFTVYLYLNIQNIAKLPNNFHLHFFPLRKFSYVLYMLQYKFTV